ncbi:hypothetical protein [Umezawaea sp.]|uniref:hypothetical protein n=1 Tax=Umezawaea sp. TaxID=1955258 RepID=UPI002ED1788A
MDGEVRPDVAANTALDLVFAPPRHRLPVPRAPVDARCVDAAVDLRLAGPVPRPPDASPRR